MSYRSLHNLVKNIHNQIHNSRQLTYIEIQYFAKTSSLLNKHSITFTSLSCTPSYKWSVHSIADSSSSPCTQLGSHLQNYRLHTRIQRFNLVKVFHYFFSFLFTKYYISFYTINLNKNHGTHTMDP